MIRRRFITCRAFYLHLAVFSERDMTERDMRRVPVPRLMSRSAYLASSGDCPLKSQTFECGCMNREPGSSHRSACCRDQPDRRSRRWSVIV